MPKQYLPRYKCFCFTLNNPSDDEVSKLKTEVEKEDSLFQYLLYGLERGDEGTLHLQGYFELKKKVSFNTAKSIFGCDRVHIERRKGTVKQACDYCRKDGQVYEHGVCSAQGHRSDLDLAIDVLRRTGISGVAESQPGVFVRHARGLRDLYFTIAQRKYKTQFRFPRVSVYWGAPGTGKTFSAFSEAPDDCFILRRGNTGVWFDGYAGEKILIIDDFKGWIQFQQLLVILDRYPLSCEIKGGHVWAGWERVIITSNYPPDQWYDYEKNNLCRGALMRRINEIKYFDTVYVSDEVDTNVIN